MQEPKCPKCGENIGFELAPVFPNNFTFIPDETGIVQETFSLSIKCKSCGENFKVVDFNTSQDIEGLRIRVDKLEGRS